MSVASGSALQRSRRDSAPQIQETVMPKFVTIGYGDEAGYQKTKLLLHYSRQRLRVIWPQNRAFIRLSETLKYHRYVGNLAELRRFRERLSY